ncbi:MULTISPECIES: ribosome recycling factor [unclassified Fusibacter]|uniref:ribosome recycling factor n=1 Tax=unclassified Fusibacter TaxID=2624464 RepID=UPI001012338F|nr:MULTISPECIES: ribosome recycling factor [unclassified Fusibacter]MCK8058792.1 ribosome recycling factor [Fusibacter sp. A2]NPE21866.1 ribosome recycling factor [Fusibacter sp. A1]RXV61438.1 ribosome recycling factor [Fusibacter sp. A1]
MHVQVHDEMKTKMTKTVSVLKEELMSIRAGRANPHILDRVMVSYYGSETPLSQMANISAPEPRMIQVQPYDTTVISDIERAIMMADLGINPSNDGKMIRIAMPILTEERRKDLVKMVKKIGEESKVALRNERREANDKLKKLNKNNELTEDDLKRSEKEVQETTDKFMKEVDELVVRKEAEVMEV